MPMSQVLCYSAVLTQASRSIRWALPVRARCKPNLTRPYAGKGKATAENSADELLSLQQAVRYEVEVRRFQNMHVRSKIRHATRLELAGD